MMGFFRNPDNLVYLCRTEGSWAMVSRDVIKVTTDKALTEFQVQDSKATETFYESLDPEAWAESKKVAMASLGLEMPHTHGPQLERPNPTGQYL